MNSSFCSKLGLRASNKRPCAQRSLNTQSNGRRMVFGSWDVGPASTVDLILAGGLLFRMDSYNLTLEHVIILKVYCTVNSPGFAHLAKWNGKLTFLSASIEMFVNSFTALIDCKSVNLLI